MLKFPKPKDVKKKVKKRSHDNYKEDEIQKAVENILIINGFKYFHIPDYLLYFIRTKAPAKLAKIVSQVFKGLPDLVVFSPNNSYNDCYFYYRFVV